MQIKLTLSIFTLAMGLVIGSFLNVVIYRLPRGKSLWNPPSHCPSCKKILAWYDNIPILSFILLHGRCRNCKSPISWRYPVVEGMSGLFFLFILLHWYPFLFLGHLSFVNPVKEFVFISFLIPTFFIDLEHQIIPDSLSYPLLFSGIFFSFLQGFFLPSLAGIALGAGIFLAIFYLSLLILHQAGMGIGDVKLAAGIGAYFGWKMALLSFFLAFLTGAVVACILLVFHLKGIKDKIPFGPFLVTGAFLTLFLGKDIINLYFSLFW